MTAVVPEAVLRLAKETAKYRLNNSSLDIVDAPE